MCSLDDVAHGRRHLIRWTRWGKGASTDVIGAFEQDDRPHPRHRHDIAPQALHPGGTAACRVQLIGVLLARDGVARDCRVGHRQAPRCGQGVESGREDIGPPLPRWPVGQESITHRVTQDDNRPPRWGLRRYDIGPPHLAGVVARSGQRIVSVIHGQRREGLPG